MGEKINKIKLIAFIKSHKTEINAMQMQFVDLFNECGKKHNNQAIQLAFTGSVIALFLKNTNIPKQETTKLLENLTKKFK